MNENDFYSMDKLVEFGMGMAVATQMANSMNLGLQQMKMPGVDNPMNTNGSSIEAVYFAVLNDKTEGPFSSTELARLVAEKKISRETYIWKPGMQNWDLAENISEVLQLVALTPPPIPED